MLIEDKNLSAIDDIIPNHRVFLVGGYLRNYFLNNEIAKDNLARYTTFLNTIATTEKDYKDAVAMIDKFSNIQNEDYDAALEDILKAYEGIYEYASKISKDITGRDDTPVYMSNSYNDVPVPSENKRTADVVTFLGEVDGDEIYMDLYKGWVDTDDLTRGCNLFKIN